jgi:hypothetical protein
VSQSNPASTPVPRNSGAEPFEKGPASESEHEHFSQENFPELNERQIQQLREGKLPGQIKIQAITLVIACVAVVLSLTALFVGVM